VPEVVETVADGELATRLAQVSGDLLRTAAAGGLLGDSALGMAGDAISHLWLAACIGRHRPDDGLLSEEGAADPSRLERQRVWIVDPLDGTREYSEGRLDWAVHVALVVDGDPAIAAVALPALGEVMTTTDPAPLPPPPQGSMRIAVSRTRCPAVAQSVAAKLGAELVPMGSAGFKTMAVVRGEVHAYLHAGGQYEWDSAAPVGVATSRGLHASRLDGSPLRYNRPDPLLPDLLVCRPEVTEELLGAVAATDWAP